MNTQGMPVFSLNQIPILGGSNYIDWKDQLMLHLGMQNLDVCLLQDKPAELTPESTKDQKDEYYKWVRANSMALNIIKLSMSKTVKGSIPKKELAKEYLEAVALKFKENEKAEASQLMHTFDTMRYNGSGNVREYIMKMIDIATKLNDLEMPLKDDYVIQHALNTLPNTFSQLKTSYFSQKDKWSLDEFIAICTQDENRIRREKELTVNLVDKPEWKHANKLKPNKTNGAAVVKPDQKLKPFQFMCYFCKKNGHMKRDCNSYKNWVSKRGVHKEEGTEEK